jgi:hypothetical protein
MADIGKRNWHPATSPRKRKLRISSGQSTSLSDGSWTAQCPIPRPWILAMTMCLSQWSRKKRRLNAPLLSVWLRPVNPQSIASNSPSIYSPTTLSPLRRVRARQSPPPGLPLSNHSLLLLLSQRLVPGTRYLVWTSSEALSPPLPAAQLVRHRPLPARPECLGPT